METFFNFHLVLTDNKLLIFVKGDCDNCQYYNGTGTECRLCKEKGNEDEMIHKIYNLIDLL